MFELDLHPSLFSVLAGLPVVGFDGGNLPNTTSVTLTLNPNPISESVNA